MITNQNCCSLLDTSAAVLVESKQPARKVRTAVSAGGSVIRLRQQAIEGFRLENALWLVMAAASLAVLVLSFAS